MNRRLAPCAALALLASSVATSCKSTTVVEVCIQLDTVTVQDSLGIVPRQCP